MSDDPHGQGEMPPWLQPVLEQEEEGGFQSDKLKKMAAFGGLGILLVFVIILGVMYFGGDSSDRGPVTVTAQEGPVRQKPEDPGGMKVEGRDMEVYDVVSGEQQDTAQDIGNVAEEPVSEIPAEQRSALEDKAAEIVEAAEDTASQVADDVADSAPAEVPAEQPSRDEVVDRISDTVAAAREEEADPAPAQPEPTPAPVTLPSNLFKVQLGAFSKKTTAENTWDGAKRKFGSYLGGMTSIIDEVPRSSGGVLHRLRAGPVPNRAEADRICLALKAGNQPCMVVKPE